MKIDRQKLIEEQHVFNRTFLNECVVKVDFPLIDDNGVGKRISRFLKKCYNIDTTDFDGDDAFSQIDLNAKESGLRFCFSREGATLTVSHQSYACFARSVLPYTRPLADFVKIVCLTDQIENIVVRKQNVWTLTAQNPTIDIINGLNMIFSPERRAEMPEIIADENQILSGVAFETIPQIKDCEYPSRIRVVVKGDRDKRLTFFLDTEIESGKHIEVDTLPAVAMDLNDLAYRLYIDLVSDDILNMMGMEG